MIIHSGSEIEFYITEIFSEIVLIGDKSIFAEEDHRPRFEIYFDDDLFLNSAMNDLELVVELFKNEIHEDENHKIKVILLSENNQGGIEIKNIYIYIYGSQKAIEPVE